MILCGAGLMVSRSQILRDEVRLTFQAFVAISLGFVIVAVSARYMLSSSPGVNLPPYTVIDPALPSIGVVVGFAAFMSAILYRVLGWWHGWKCAASVWTSWFIVLVGAVALVGHWLSIPAMFWYKEHVTTGMGIPTAIGFVALGIGLAPRKFSTENETGKSL